MAEPIIIEGPDGNEYEFPAGTDDATIKGAMAKQFPKGWQRQPSVATGTPDFMNGGMDLVSDGGPQNMPSPKVPLGFRMASPLASAGMKIGADMRTREGRQEWLGRAKAMPGMLAHGATSGLSDEITGGFAEGRFPADPIGLYASGLTGLYNEVTGNTSPAYDLLSNKKNEEIATTREKYPVTSLVSEGAGASMIPMGSLGQGKTVLGTALRTGAAGALAGGGYSFADADGDLSQRTTSGLIGAGVGGAGGVTLGALSRALAGDPDSIARVLDTEVVGPISSDAAKVIERVIRSANANITGRDVSAALQRLEQRVQGGVDGPAVPTRLKDFLIEEFPDAAEHITSFLSGVGRRGATAGSDVIENAVTEDIGRLRTFYEDAANARMGGTSRVDMADGAEEAKKILSQRYDEVLSNADPNRPEAQQLRELVMSDPGAQTALKRKAMNRGLSVEEYVNQFPDEAGHWMRSRASTASRSAQGTEKVDLQDTVALYDDLLESNPNYAEVKRGWGTESGFEEALRFGDKFFSNAKDDLDFREMKRVYDRMSPYEKEAARASIRQKFITEGLEGNKAGQNVRTTQAGRESALRGLRSMLGDEGDAFATDIEQMMARIEGNAAISRRGKSPTAYLQKADEFAGKMASGSMGNALANLLSGGVKDTGLSIGASMVSGNPVVLPFNAAKGAMNIAGNALNSRADQRLRQATTALMRDVTPPPRVAAPPPPQAPAPGGIPSPAINQQAQAGAFPVGKQQYQDLVDRQSQTRQSLYDYVAQRYGRTVDEGGNDGFISGLAQQSNDPQLSRLLDDYRSATNDVMQGSRAAPRGQAPQAEPQAPPPIRGAGFSGFGNNQRPQSTLAPKPTPRDADLANRSNARAYDDVVAQVEATQNDLWSYARQRYGVRVDEGGNDAVINRLAAEVNDPELSRRLQAYQGALRNQSDMNRVGAAPGRQAGERTTQLSRQAEEAQQRLYAYAKAKGFPVDEGGNDGFLNNVVRQSGDPEFQRLFDDYQRAIQGQGRARGFNNSGTATLGNDMANALVGGTVGGIGGSLSGNFNDYNGDGVIDEKDRQIGFLRGTAAGAFLAPIGTRIGVKGHRFDMKGAAPKTAKQAIRAELPGSPEYQRAVAKGLDMSPDGRAMRAREQGYNTEKVLYHGTGRDFKAFDPKAKSDWVDTAGGDIYLTDHPSVASEYAMESRGSANVLPVYTKTQNPMVVNLGGKLANDAKTKELVTQAKALGHDSLVLENARDGVRSAGPASNITVVFDPANIRSVNAAFDPDMAASPMLSAGLKGGGLRYGDDPTKTQNIFRDVTGKPFNADQKATKRLNRMMANNSYIDVKLPTNRINATQESVHPGFAENTANRYLEGAGGVEAPAVVKYKGQYYATDGHHRITTAAVRDGKDVRVRLYDLDGTTDTSTPLLDFNPKKHEHNKKEIDALYAALFDELPPISGAGFSGRKPPKLPRTPKLMSDVPKGTPPKGGNPKLGQGNLIRQQYEGTNPPRLPEGPMTDAQLTARKAREAAMPLIEQGMSGEAIRQQTGVQTLTYKGQTVILPPYLNGVNNEAIHRFFYDSLKQPFEKRPKWVKNALRQMAGSEEDALRQQSLWDQKNPLALGTERTPMVKEGSLMNAALGTKKPK